MGNASSAEEGTGPYLAPPSILTKVSVKGDKAEVDAFVTKGRVDNVQIGYLTKRQVRPFLFSAKRWLHAVRTQRTTSRSCVFFEEAIGLLYRCPCWLLLVARATERARGAGLGPSSRGVQNAVQLSCLAS